MDGHYDRKADIAWLRLDGWDPERVSVDERPWGLIERDRETGGVLGLEYWKASKPFLLNCSMRFQHRRRVTSS